MTRSRLLFLSFSLLAAAPLAWADTVTVPYNGSFDEADVPGPQDGLPAGDYDTIGGLPDVGLFKLVDGNNTFEGSVWTPGDSGDLFLIGIAPEQVLTGARIDFGTNLSSVSRMFAFPPPQWTLEESDDTPTIFNLTVGSDGLASTDVKIAPPFQRREGVYNVFVGNGTFGINTGNFQTPIDYTMTFSTIFPVAGDLNADGAVDSADASVIFSNWGSVPPGDPIADINGDGVVDAADASEVFTNWTGDSVSAVPEPSTAVTVMLSMLGLALGCRNPDS